MSHRCVDQLEERIIYLKKNKEDIFLSHIFEILNADFFTCRRFHFCIGGNRFRRLLYFYITKTAEKK